MALRFLCHISNNTRDRVSSEHPNTQTRVENRRTAEYFDKTTGVWMVDETLSWVFDIPLQLKQKLRSKRRSKIVKIPANEDQVSKPPSRLCFCLFQFDELLHAIGLRSCKIMVWHWLARVIQKQHVEHALRKSPRGISWKRSARLMRVPETCKALVKRRVIVDDSWFSSNYHQLSPTIVQMVKRPKKLVIVDDGSPSVAQAKSREQRVPSFFRVNMRILNGVP